VGVEKYEDVDDLSPPSYVPSEGSPASDGESTTFSVCFLSLIPQISCVSCRSELKFEPLEFATIEPYLVPQQQLDGYGDLPEFYDPEYLEQLQAGNPAQLAQPAGAAAANKGAKGARATSSAAAKPRQSKAASTARATSPATAQSTEFAVPGATTSKTSERRAEQNRQAQKTFREKKTKYVTDLEEKLEEASHNSRLSELLKQENTDLRSVILSLQSENDRLRQEKELTTNFTFTGQVPNFGASPTSAASAAGSPASAVSATSPPASSGELQSVPTKAKAAASSPGDLSLVPEHVGSSPFITLESALLVTPPLPSPSLNTVFSPLNPSPSLAYFESSAMMGFPTDLFQHSDPTQYRELPTLEQQSRPLDSGQEWDLSEFLTSESLIHEGTKRTLEEASFYSHMPLPFKPITLQKDENGEKDKVETEICDMMKKIHCKDKNPELAHNTKYIKKAM